VYSTEANIGKEIINGLVHETNKILQQICTEKNFHKGSESG